MCLFVFFISVRAEGQQLFSLMQQKQFAAHLAGEHLFNDCLLLLDEVEKNYALNTAQRDSFNHLHALCFAKKEMNDSAASRFALISKNSSFYPGSAFNAALYYCIASRLADAERSLSSFYPVNENQAQLKDFYDASSLLLQHKYSAFYDFCNNRNNFNTYFSGRISELKFFSSKLEKAQRKSGFLAGVMSAFIPGSGKIYAGKPRQGFVSMLPLAIMGLQAYEAYSKDGLASPRFIVFGGLFSLFYIGNIWGSVLSVSVRKQEIQHEIYNEVVLGLRVSLQHVLGEGR